MTQKLLKMHLRLARKYYRKASNLVGYPLLIEDAMKWAQNHEREAIRLNDVYWSEER